MGIQIYDQVSILRSWSKAKLHRAILLGFVLKELKITLNIMKVGVHSYLPNAHLNLWSKFNSMKLVKSQTPSCGFAKIGVKGGENSSKRREGSMLIYPTSIQIYDQISILRNWSKEKLYHAKVALKGSEIARNIKKVGVYACLLKWVPKSSFKFHFWKSKKKVHLFNFCLTILEWGPK